MRVIILSAGRGERLRPLTDNTPKPLIKIGGESLIVRHIKNLRQNGFTDIVINTAHLGELIQQTLGDGDCWGVRIHYSAENPVLEVGGGIRQAIARDLLPADSPFLCVNADIICDINFAAVAARLPADAACHLVLADNPPNKSRGDFSLTNGRITLPTETALTYSGVGVYRPQLFADLPPGKKANLLPLIQKAIAAKQAGGEKHNGIWRDTGTHDSLAAAQKMFAR